MLDSTFLSTEAVSLQFQTHDALTTLTQHHTRQKFSIPVDIIHTMLLLKRLLVTCDCTAQEKAEQWTELQIVLLEKPKKIKSVPELHPR